MKWRKGKHIGRKLIFEIGIILIIMAMVKAKANNRRQYTTYVVQQGDTIWSIATDNNIYHDVRKMVYKIREINNDNNCIIFPGQELLIPVKQ